MGDEFKCKASSDERYYGYAGAFRWAVITVLLSSPEPLSFAS